jgi:hypothetical protein
MFRRSWVVGCFMLASALLANVPLERAEETTAPPDVIVLRGCPLGGVLFAHRVHAENYAGARLRAAASLPQLSCQAAPATHEDGDPGGLP